MESGGSGGCPAGVAGSPIGLVTGGILTAAFVNSATTQAELQQNNAGTFAGRIEQTTLAAGLRPNQQFGIVTFLDSGGDSYYHAFQSTLRRRFANGFQVMLAYTFSKSIDNQSVDPVASSSGGGLSTTTSRAPADIRDWRQERGVSEDYIRGAPAGRFADGEVGPAVPVQVASRGERCPENG